MEHRRIRYSTIARSGPANPRNDTASVVELTNGDLLVVWHKYKASAEQGHDLARCRIHAKTSVDRGMTWGDERMIVDIAPGDLNVQAPAIVRLPAGGQFGQHNTAWCWLSDDGGRSWVRSRSVVDLPMRGAMEASVAELGDGRVFMSLRTQLGSVFLSCSGDGGDTWSLPQTTGLKAPESGTCLRRIPDSDALLLIWNDGRYEPAHHHYGRRRPLSMAVSADGCRSWRRVGDLAGGDYELTNIGCTFTTAGDAVVTYLQVEDCVWERFTRSGIDLRAAIVPVSRLLDTGARG